MNEWIKKKSAHPQQDTSTSFKQKQPKNQTNKLLVAYEHPSHDDEDAWRAYWQTHGQLWRVKPEIDEVRQKELAVYRSILPAIDQGIYPFKDVTLSRADIEWLLATHEGSVTVDVGNDQQHEQVGIDLRAANLRQVDLQGLPLKRICGGINRDERNEQSKISIKKRELASVHMEGCDLRGADLEDANLYGAHLEGADLREAHLESALLSRAHLERADLRNANLDGAYLSRAHLENSDLCWARLRTTDLHDAFLEGADLREVQAEKANLSNAHLEGTHLNGACLKEADLYNAYLEGAELREVNFGGANLSKAHLEGKEMLTTDLERVQGWTKKFPAMLPPADIRGAVFDMTTNLENVTFGDDEFGSISLVDVRWNDVNFTVVDWTKVKLLGDELRAQQLTTNAGKAKEIEVQITEYQAAMRANRQLSVGLQNQGLNEDASYFAYRAQSLQRQVLQLQVMQRLIYLQLNNRHLLIHLPLILLPLVFFLLGFSQKFLLQPSLLAQVDRALLVCIPILMLPWVIHLQATRWLISSPPFLLRQEHLLLFFIQILLAGILILQIVICMVLYLPPLVSLLVFSLCLIPLATKFSSNATHTVLYIELISIILLGFLSTFSILQLYSLTCLFAL